MGQNASSQIWSWEHVLREDDVKESARLALVTLKLGDRIALDEWA